MLKNLCLLWNGYHVLSRYFTAFCSGRLSDERTKWKPHLNPALYHTFALHNHNTSSLLVQIVASTHIQTKLCPAQPTRSVTDSPADYAATTVRMATTLTDLPSELLLLIFDRINRLSTQRTFA